MRALIFAVLLGLVIAALAKVDDNDKTTKKDDQKKPGDGMGSASGEGGGGGGGGVADAVESPGNGVPAEKKTSKEGFYTTGVADDAAELESTGPAGVRVFDIDIRETSVDGCESYSDSFVIATGQKDFVDALRTGASFTWERSGGAVKSPELRLAALRERAHYGKDVVTYAALDATPRPFAPASIVVSPRAHGAPARTFDVDIQDTTADGLPQFDHAFAIMPGQTALVDALRMSSSFKLVRNGIEAPPLRFVEFLPGVHFRKDVIRYRTPPITPPKSFERTRFKVVTAPQPMPSGRRLARETGNETLEAPSATAVADAPVATADAGGGRATRISEQGSLATKLRDLAQRVTIIADEYDGVYSAGVQPVGIQSTISL